MPTPDKILMRKIKKREKKKLKLISQKTNGTQEDHTGNLYYIFAISTQLYILLLHFVCKCDTPIKSFIISVFSKLYTCYIFL